VKARGRGSPLDPFIPIYDARERFQLVVRAPAPLVYRTAADFDFESIRLVRAIISLRGRLLGSRAAARRVSRGVLTDAPALGWGVLREEVGRVFVAGAHCQPWLPDVVFAPLTAATFAPFASPDRVKIAWTLEVDPVDGTRCILATETRAVATDGEARERFRRYWRWARFGIYTIRWLLLPAIRREAQAGYRRRSSPTGS
jgi:hypothetical protein